MAAAAVDEVAGLVLAMNSPNQGRRLAFSTVPSVIDYYGAGAALLAVNAYDEKRAQFDLGTPFEAEPFVTLDEGKLFASIAWATAPLYAEKLADSITSEVTARFRDVVSDGVANAGRSTTIGNLRQDPSALGWARVTGGHGCDFCRMLASRGAVYRKEITAVFAAHDNCDCTAEAYFRGEKFREADVMQYMASKRARTRAEKDALNEYVRDWSGDVA